LSISTAPPIPPGAEDQFVYFDLFLTNVSEQTCTMQGYPGVDFLGPDDPMLGGPVIHLARTGGDVQPVVLAPGGSATSLLGFQIKTSDVGPQPAWPPTTIVVTPPDSTTQLQIPWPSDGYTIQQIGDGTTNAATVGPLSLSE